MDRVVQKRSAVNVPPKFISPPNRVNDVKSVYEIIKRVLMLPIRGIDAIDVENWRAEKKKFQIFAH